MRRSWPLAALGILLVVSGEGRAEDEASGKTETGSIAAAADDPNEGGVEPLVLERFAPRPLTAADLPPANPLLANYTYRTSAMFGRDWRAGRAEYRQLVERESLAFGLPPALVDAVMAVESRYNPGVVGMDGEVGLMQVMLPTARMMGFAGTPAELASPEVNVHYGVRYLAGAWRRANGDLCTAAMKYRAGHGETRFSYLSVEYCTRVRAHLAANGVAVTGSVPQPTFGRPSGGGGGTSRGSRVLTSGSTINFAALNTRLRGVVERRAPSDLR
ncbi:transglycosylase SLT domain-containing protein [Bradyrhizobium liaoningense]|uniref:lytic transglycosylase domain-containing protein n=1 Tax=Bradyrhizobium liaoningense TaxID=43992 RepID=UPI001BA91D7F|nr:transglycosylase SLT domain-containing protein [Bradyrhizobium liaoningense]MBR0838984.1 transglycosylase SLT domain-containing protein [Bradyrhizobium liaoningense]MBR0858753.1 transglycosylase SLT domain-containing protein [Bradyrhizobium liaoningense]